MLLRFTPPYPSSNRPYYFSLRLQCVLTSVIQFMKFVIRFYSVLKSSYSVHIQIYSSLLHCQYVQSVWSQIYSFLLHFNYTSTRLQSDQQRFWSKYIEHINNSLLIWKYNLLLINMVHFSMEQMQVLSTLNMMNIVSYKWCWKQSNNIKTSENNVNNKNKKSWGECGELEHAGWRPTG